MSRAGASATHRRQTPEPGLPCARRRATATIAGLWYYSGGARHFLPREVDRKVHRKARRDPTRDGGMQEGFSLRTERSPLCRPRSEAAAEEHSLGFSCLLWPVASAAASPPACGCSPAARPPPPPYAAGSRGPSARRGLVGAGGGFFLPGGGGVGGGRGSPGFGGSRVPKASHPELPQLAHENTARVVPYELEVK